MKITIAYKNKKSTQAAILGARKYYFPKLIGLEIDWINLDYEGKKLNGLLDSETHPDKVYIIDDEDGIVLKFLRENKLCLEIKTINSSDNDDYFSEAYKGANGFAKMIEKDYLDTFGYTIMYTVNYSDGKLGYSEYSCPNYDIINNKSYGYKTKEEALIRYWEQYKKYLDSNQQKIDEFQEKIRELQKDNDTIKFFFAELL